MKKKTQRKYWYFTKTIECVLCWHQEIRRRRVYTKKPKDGAKRYEFEQTACGSHFC